MAKVNVSVRCESCRTIGPKGDITHTEMVGSQYMYEQKTQRTQARTYTCPDCGTLVTVELSFGD